ncbi:hypothetical protein EB796_001560 [Bugula neritina]|uniref:Uncharacterized protein n=1 Tax=Bugula neritina TaxID=10212 RepID=A0A7J7KPK8_BUGNE|nr:hypothetical protein EB796_021814 [Bugula neritina]KAF6040120.1 hypothetical protein EB796_001560 [Bugula neritina]
MKDKSDLSQAYSVDSPYFLACKLWQMKPMRNGVVSIAHTRTLRQPRSVPSAKLSDLPSSSQKISHQTFIK